VPTAKKGKEKEAKAFIVGQIKGFSHSEKDKEVLNYVATHFEGSEGSARGLPVHLHGVIINGIDTFSRKQTEVQTNAEGQQANTEEQIRPIICRQQSAEKGSGRQEVQPNLC
jgi:hypothetical protein